MKKFTLYLGLNDKDTKVQTIGTLEAYKVAMNIIKNYTDGVTIFEARGMYVHDDGTMIEENTLRIELMFVERKEVLSIINSLKQIFNQETIALQEQDITSELI